MSYRIINGKAYPIGNIGGINSLTKDNTVKENNKDNFKKLLEKEIEKKSFSDEGYKISNHAAERLKDVNFTKEDYTSLQNGLDKAKEKGSKNTLMLYKNMAIIASVENKTIITAVDKQRAKENVFTNIDSVVIL
ncbi:flagellar operon protein [Clostridium cavendishii DSM 21758]|uniref:Flagellar operon protein n=1 Tax=Clostridium cavendishii DSM 21758 TaxID=1121302 RepID=A0A1M6AUJ0_9CLOT|nr:TIGR02530 family flagellar biosynthesis protein [Clostridium cavendishii]SHI40199.1 flagellar operon protein [Clostridium cavendishii DSM 21758]